MKLKDYIKNYRETNRLSLRDLSSLCGISSAYLNSLEHGYNLHTKKVISPTMTVLQKLAKGTNIDLNALILLLDKDQTILIPAREKQPVVNEIENKVEHLSKSEQDKVLTFVNYLLAEKKKANQ